jgi:O-acetyl-ADP-ribose deacetylase (regulator of RNase III)
MMWILLMGSWIISLAIGIILLFVLKENWGEGYSEIFNYATWFFLSIFPPLVLFTLDVGSSAEGRISSFTVGGAFAAYLLTFFLATSLTSKAHKRATEQYNKELKEKNQELQEKNQELEWQITAMKPNRIQGLIFDEFTIRGTKNRKLRVIGGQLRHINGIDLWVNSENTNMQMARWHDQSISGVIRYFGAKQEHGDVTEDTIMNELQKEMGDKRSVNPATVLVTSAGELEKSNGVKRILHVASAFGHPGGGYQQITNLEDCITNVMRKADELNMDQPPGQKYKSILIPFIGTGTAGADYRNTAKRLLMTAASSLQERQESEINQVCFITPTDIQHNACLELLNDHELVRLVAHREDKVI